MAWVGGMMTRRRFGVGALAGWMGVAGARLALARQETASPKSPAALDLMTFNLRYASATGANRWPVRRPLVSRVLREQRPDVVGTQEGLHGQVRDIAEDSGMDWIGLGRDGGSRGEFMAVFYLKDRLAPVAFDHFWLSDTPEVMGSATWGNSNRRMVTWVEFEDRRTGSRFQFWNTHFDHEVEEARRRSAALVAARIGKVPASTPVVLAGDFNALSGRSRSYEILTAEGGLKDTWHAASARSEEDANSFNGFEDLARKGERIDWILYRGTARVTRAGVVTTRVEGQWPSDHCPVTARLEW